MMNSRRGYTPLQLMVRAFVVATLAAVGFLHFFGKRGNQELNQLSQKTGMQWDTEMQGPWVRQSQPEKTGIQIYRIHIVDQANSALSEKNRTFRPGDKVAVTFHYRTHHAGKFEPKVTVTGPSPVVAKQMKPVLVDKGGFQQFRSTLIPFRIPDNAQVGAYQLRLQVTDTQSNQVGYWETDIEVK